MSTILKDAELSAGAHQVAPQTTPPAVPDSRSLAAPAEPPSKPQPVALEVNVTVNGARTLEGSDKREPFSESTKTVLVFGNGAVIRLQSSVAPGQLLFLTNEKTKKEVVCQVVKSKNYRSVSGYVELEFTEPVIGFWGMRFPGDRLAPAAAAPVTPAPIATPPLPAAGTPSAPSAIAPSPTAPAQKSSTVVAAQDAKAPASSTAPHVPSSDVLPAGALRSPVSKSAPVPVDSAAPATPLPPASPVTPFPTKPNVSVSSTASSSVLSLPPVLTLPRASEPKPSPLSSTVMLAPEPAKPVAPSPISAKPSPEDPTAALKAENARLQQQLASFLFPESKQSVPLAAVEHPAAPKPAAETAAKILEIAHTGVSPVSPAAPQGVEPGSTPTKPSATPAPPPVIAAQPSVPAKAPTTALTSLFEHEELKIPSWLEPLARNAAIPAPPPQATPDSSAAAFKHESHVSAPGSASLALVPPLDDAVGAKASPSQTLSSLFIASETPDAQATSPRQESTSLEISTHDFDFHQHSSSEPASHEDQLEDESLPALPEPNFGSGLRLGEQSADGAPHSSKKLLFAVAAAVVLAGLGGLWYTGKGAPILNAVLGSTKSSPSSLTLTSSASSAPAPLGNAPSSATTPANSGLPAVAANVPASAAIKDKAATPAALSANLVVSPNRAAAPTAAAPVSAAPTTTVQPTVQPSASAQKRPSLGDVHLASPTVARRTDDSSVSDADPTLNGSATPADAPVSQGFTANSGPAAPSAPIPIGGDVKAAKLLKSVPPVYPAFAKTQRVSGDVKIDALIDAAGKVTTMKVVGGPVMLHQAAMDALRQWHYQPATLDGSPVAMHLTVTIQFRIQ